MKEREKGRREGEGGSMQRGNKENRSEGKMRKTDLKRGRWKPRCVRKERNNALNKLRGY